MLDITAAEVHALYGIKDIRTKYPFFYTEKVGELILFNFTNEQLHYCFKENDRCFSHELAINSYQIENIVNRILANKKTHITGDLIPYYVTDGVEFVKKWDIPFATITPCFSSGGLEKVSINDSEIYRDFYKKRIVWGMEQEIEAIPLNGDILVSGDFVLEKRFFMCSPGDSVDVLVNKRNLKGDELINAVKRFNALYYHRWECE